MSTFWLGCSFPANQRARTVTRDENIALSTMKGDVLKKDAVFCRYDPDFW